MNKSIPKPYGIYFYSIGIVGCLWEVVIHASKKGWSFFIHNIKKDEFPRMGQFYDSKSAALERANVELLDLGFTKKDIKLMTLRDSRYEYPTFPRIYIKPKGNKWKWQCGKHTGIEKNKKLALEAACKHREDS